MEKNKTRWIVVAILAAVVAALTTVLVLVLRARAKKNAWYDEEAFDYDLEDGESFEFGDEEIEAIAIEE